MPVSTCQCRHSSFLHPQVTAAAAAATRAELAAWEAVASSPNRMDAARQQLEAHQRQRLQQRPPVQQARACRPCTASVVVGITRMTWLPRFRDSVVSD